MGRGRSTGWGKFIIQFDRGAGTNGGEIGFQARRVEKNEGRGLC